MKRLFWILLLVFLLAACSSKATPTNTAVPTNTATDTPEPTATITPEPPTPTPTETATPIPTEINLDPLADHPDEGFGPVGFPENVNPLTGLLVDDPAILDRRPVAIKISNELREIRPQWGLSQADHVFEYYQEYGETRFHAIFYGTDASEVGPIRSARFPDADFIQAYKSVFAFASADYRVRWTLFNSDYANRLYTFSDVPCPPTITHPTCRIDPNQWNHLMTDTAIFSQYFTVNGVPNGRQYLDGLLFNKYAPEDGQIADSLTVRFSKSHYHKWEYDPDSRSYLRFDDASTDNGEGETFEPTIDRANDQPVRADNVVVLFAPHSFYSRDPEIVQIELTGYNGKALLFRDGQAYLVNWVRANNNEIISLTYEDGSRIPLKPGNTWFEVVGTASLIQQESPEWRVQFQTP